MDREAYENGLRSGKTLGARVEIVDDDFSETVGETIATFRMVRNRFSEYQWRDWIGPDLPFDVGTWGCALEVFWAAFPNLEDRKDEKGLGSTLTICVLVWTMWTQEADHIAEWVSNPSFVKGFVDGATDTQPINRSSTSS